MNKVNNNDYFSYLSTVLLEAQKSKATVEEDLADEDLHELDTEKKIITPKINNKEELESEEIAEEPYMDEIPPEEEIPNEEVPMEPEMEEDPAMAGLDDASYMGAPEPEPTIDDVVLRQQKTKLFDNFSDLSKSIETATAGFKSKLSPDMIDKKQYSVLEFSVDKLEKLQEKIRDFQIESFLLRDYEECLYVYMLFRSELLTTLQYVRKTLRLNSVKEEDLKNNQKENKK